MCHHVARSPPSSLEAQERFANLAAGMEEQHGLLAGGDEDEDDLSTPSSRVRAEMRREAAAVASPREADGVQIDFLGDEQVSRPMVMDPRVSAMMRPGQEAEPEPEHKIVPHTIDPLRVLEIFTEFNRGSTNPKCVTVRGGLARASSAAPRSNARQRLAPCDRVQVSSGHHPWVTRGVC